MKEVFECSYKEIVNIDDLVPHPLNTNEHSDEQIIMLAKIIKNAGQRSPIVVSNFSGFITKGHGRLLAMKRLGWSRVAVDFQDYDNTSKEFLDMNADNEIARLAVQNHSKMLANIQKHKIEIPDNDFELMGMSDLSFLVSEASIDDDDDEIEETKRVKQYILVLNFKNDMDMMDVYDDLKEKGIQVTIKG